MRKVQRKTFYNPALKKMGKEELSNHILDKTRELQEINRQAQKFTMKKELNLIDKYIIDLKDQELTMA